MGDHVELTECMCDLNFSQGVSTLQVNFYPLWIICIFWGILCVIISVQKILSAVHGLKRRSSLYWLIKSEVHLWKEELLKIADLHSSAGEWRLASDDINAALKQRVSHCMLCWVLAQAAVFPSPPTPVASKALRGARWVTAKQLKTQRKVRET